MRRFLRFLKWAGLLFLGVLGIVLIVTAVCTVVAEVRLERRIAALRAAGEPMSLADLAGEPISPELNAATYLCRAKSICAAIYSEVNSAEETAPEPERKAFDDEGIIGPAGLKSLRAALVAFPRLAGLLEQAAKAPGYDPQLDGTTDNEAFIQALLSEVQDMRNAVRVLSYRSMLQLADGQPEEALQTCLLIFRLARHADRNPMTIGQLVALAIRGLAIHDVEQVLRADPLPQSSYDALEAELSQHDVIQAFRHAVRTERTYGLQAFRSMATKVPGASIFPWLKNEEADYLDVMDQSVQAAEVPYWEWQSRYDAIHAEGLGTFAQMLLPALQINRQAVARVQAQLNALRVLGAILRREPAGNAGDVVLDELGLPADATIDPFNGEPLHVKKLPDGWAIYAVGKDLIDDGGIIEVNSDGPDVGVGLAHIPAAEAAEPEKAPASAGGESDANK